MKVVHIMLCGPVTDGWSYQDNLLTKYHKKLGHDVTMITSQWVWGTDSKLEKFEKSDYINENDVKVIRLPIKDDKPFEYKFKRYVGLYDAIEAELPDVLFVHGAAFCDITVIVDYLKAHRDVTAFADNHADFSNSATNWVSKNILHKVIWRHYAKKAEPYITKFYGVMPARVDFLVDIYNIDKSKTDLLCMAADDEKVDGTDKESFRAMLEGKYGIKKDDFLIVTGGKIDYAKRQTLYLMEAVKNAKADGLKLLVFGSVEDELKEEFEAYLDCENITYIGWITADESYDYFGAAELVVFPGRHSVFWEQVAGQGIPMLCKYWDGTTHVNTNGNVEFLYKDSADEMKDKILSIYNDKDYYEKLKANAMDAKCNFVYSRIAEKSLLK
ncbi:MAG: glycosyltransferase family 4 protein [Ruminococcus sp.]|nr:glycosyltransferase family 4 protein [Ruminococcus sp.]